MERAAVCMSALLLLSVLITESHLRSDPEFEFGVQGGQVEFLPMFSMVDDYVLHRVSVGGDLLLANCSQPDRPQPDGYDVKCFHDRFVLANLTLLQSGLYRAEGWIGDTIVEQKQFHLTVCVNSNEALSNKEAVHDDYAILFRLDSSVGNGSRLQLFRSYPMRLDKVLVLDTNSSLEPVVKELRGRLQLDLNNSLVTLAGLMEADFYCITWTEAQCQSVGHRRLEITDKFVFAYEEEYLTLSCILKREPPAQVYWTTPTGPVFQGRQQEVMYMLDGSLTGDYSLIIPSVSVQLSGQYGCLSSYLIKEIKLFVCTKFPPSEQLFLLNESVLLENNIEHNVWVWNWIQWYRQKTLQSEEDLILDNQNTSVLLPEDLWGRVSELHPNYSLIISNLTEGDSGLYTWGVFGKVREKSGNFSYVCAEGTIHLQYKHPLYRVYVVLTGCVLCGLCVVWFKWRNRRGGQQSGDEDLYDDVEVAERGGEQPSGCQAREGQTQQGEEDDLFDDDQDVAESSV